jgi:hypothetical protein
MAAIGVHRLEIGVHTDEIRVHTDEREAQMDEKGGALGWREDEGGACGGARGPQWGCARLEEGHARMGGGAYLNPMGHKRAPRGINELPRDTNGLKGPKRTQGAHT